MSEEEKEPKGSKWEDFILGVLGYLAMGVFGLFLLWLLWAGGGREGSGFGP